MRAGIPREQIWPALHALEAEGRITVVRVRRRLHLHAGFVSRKTALEAGLRRDLHLARLGKWMAATKPRNQKEVLDMAETWGWARSTTQYRIHRLGYKFRAPRKRKHDTAPMPRGRSYAVAPSAKRIIARLLAEPREPSAYRLRAPASQGPQPLA